jgi:hypothetical protein
MTVTMRWHTSAVNGWSWPSSLRKGNEFLSLVMYFVERMIARVLRTKNLSFEVAVRIARHRTNI